MRVVSPGMNLDMNLVFASNERLKKNVWAPRISKFTAYIDGYYVWSDTELWKLKRILRQMALKKLSVYARSAAHTR